MARQAPELSFTSLNHHLDPVSSAIVKSPLDATESPHGNDSESPHTDKTTAKVPTRKTTAKVPTQS